MTETMNSVDFDALMAPADSPSFDSSEQTPVSTPGRSPMFTLSLSPSNNPPNNQALDQSNSQPNVQLADQSSSQTNSQLSDQSNRQALSQSSDQPINQTNNQLSGQSTDHSANTASPMQLDHRIDDPSINQPLTESVHSQLTNHTAIQPTDQSSHQRHLSVMSDDGEPGAPSANASIEQPVNQSANQPNAQSDESSHGQSIAQFLSAENQPLDNQSVGDPEGLSISQSNSSKQGEPTPITSQNSQITIENGSTSTTQSSTAAVTSTAQSSTPVQSTSSVVTQSGEPADATSKARLDYDLHYTHYFAHYIEYYQANPGAAFNAASASSGGVWSGSIESAAVAAAASAASYYANYYTKQANSGAAVNEPINQAAFAVDQTNTVKPLSINQSSTTSAAQSTTSSSSQSTGTSSSSSTQSTSLGVSGKPSVTSAISQALGQSIKPLALNISRGLQNYAAQADAALASVLKNNSSAGHSSNQSDDKSSSNQSHSHSNNQPMSPLSGSHNQSIKKKKKDKKDKHRQKSGSSKKSLIHSIGHYSSSSSNSSSKQAKRDSLSTLAIAAARSPKLPALTPSINPSGNPTAYTKYATAYYSWFYRAAVALASENDTPIDCPSSPSSPMVDAFEAWSTKFYASLNRPCECSKCDRSSQAINQSMDRTIESVTDTPSYFTKHDFGPSDTPLLHQSTDGFHKHDFSNTPSTNHSIGHAMNPSKPPPDTATLAAQYYRHDYCPCRDCAHIYAQYYSRGQCECETCNPSVNQSTSHRSLNHPSSMSFFLSPSSSGAAPRSRSLADHQSSNRANHQSFGHSLLHKINRPDKHISSSHDDDHDGLDSLVESINSPLIRGSSTMSPSLSGLPPLHQSNQAHHSHSHTPLMTSFSPQFTSLSPQLHPSPPLSSLNNLYPRSPRSSMFQPINQSNSQSSFIRDVTASSTTPLTQALTPSHNHGSTSPTQSGNAASSIFQPISQSSNPSNSQSGSFMFYTSSPSARSPKFGIYSNSLIGSPTPNFSLPSPSLASMIHKNMLDLKKSPRHIPINSASPHLSHDTPNGRSFLGTPYQSMPNLFKSPLSMSLDGNGSDDKRDHFSLLDHPSISSSSTHKRSLDQNPIDDSHVNNMMYSHSPQPLSFNSPHMSHNSPHMSHNQSINQSMMTPLFSSQSHVLQPLIEGDENSDCEADDLDVDSTQISTRGSTHTVDEEEDDVSDSSPSRCDPLLHLGETADSFTALTTLSSVSKGSSCHVCKSLRPINHLIYCANNRRRRAESLGELPSGTQQCRKKFCENCCVKFHHFKPPSEQMIQSSTASTWICLACQGKCKCAACRRRKAANTTVLGGDTKAATSGSSGGGGGAKRQRQS